MQEKMIDILVPYSGRGGVEHVINRVALDLNRHGYHVRVVQLVWEHDSWLDPSIDFRPLTDHKVEHISQFYDIYATFLKESTCPDLILATPWPYLSYIARKVIRTVGCEESCKIIGWLHGPVATYEKYDVGGIPHLSQADRVFTLTKSEGAKIAEILGEEKVRVVYNPVDLEKCCKPAGKGRKEISHNLLYVGRLSEEKRVDVILKALAQVSQEWHLTVIGDGEQRGELEEQARELSLAEQVTFCGWQQEPWLYLQDQRMDIDFLVLASDYEGFALVTVEAMASGIPVISTPVGVMIELIKPGITGYLFEKNRPDQLALILNAVEKGALPIPEEAAFREAIACFREDVALDDFREKLLF
ncbi:MAG: glycosyltransferase [Lachnospiraceae bacterium]|nr:glycosyltransferase [Lachnospiraceae bacterium]